MFDFINLTLQEFIRKFNCEDVCLSYLEEFCGCLLQDEPKVFAFVYERICIPSQCSKGEWLE